MLRSFIKIGTACVTFGNDESRCLTFVCFRIEEKKKSQINKRIEINRPELNITFSFSFLPMSEWTEFVAFSLIDLSFRLKEIRSKSFEIDLIKSIVICDPTHLFTSLAFDWIPTSTDIEFFHRGQIETSRRRIKILFEQIRREIDRIPMEISAESLKSFRLFLERSLVEIRCQLISENEENLDEQLTNYYVGLGRLLSKMKINPKHFDENRIRLQSMSKTKKIEQDFISTPILRRSMSFNEQNPLVESTNSTEFDRSTFEDLNLDAETFFSLHF